MSLAKSFPRSVDRGPIEARRGRPAPGPRMAFPRSVDRGPIEAWPAGVFAATLKPARGSGAGKAASDFRDQSIAAPLKLADTRRRQPALADFRDQSIA